MQVAYTFCQYKKSDRHTLVELSSFESKKEAIHFSMHNVSVGKYMYTYFTGYKTILEVINITDLVPVSLVTKNLRKGEILVSFLLTQATQYQSQLRKSI